MCIDHSRLCVCLTVLRHKENSRTAMASKHANTLRMKRISSAYSEEQTPSICALIQTHYCVNKATRLTSAEHQLVYTVITMSTAQSLQTTAIGMHTRCRSAVVNFCRYVLKCSKNVTVLCAVLSTFTDYQCYSVIRQQTRFINLKSQFIL